MAQNSYSLEEMRWEYRGANVLIIGHYGKVLSTISLTLICFLQDLSISVHPVPFLVSLLHWMETSRETCC